ncbi:MAG: helix-turn-helix transcriptional regulator [Steroidobacteraceae bacterium]
MLTHDALVRLSRARDLLRDPEAQALSIDEIARQAAVSPYHFIRQFRALFGETPHQFRTRIRLEHAKQLLVADTPVTDVCMQLGYSSLGSFSTLFAQRFGLAPSIYRQRMRPLVRAPGLWPRQLVPGCLGLMCGLPA